MSKKEQTLSEENYARKFSELIVSVCNRSSGMNVAAIPIRRDQAPKIRLMELEAALISSVIDGIEVFEKCEPQIMWNDEVFSWCVKFTPEILKKNLPDEILINQIEKNLQGQGIDLRPLISPKYIQ